MNRNKAIEHLKVVLKTCDVQDEEAVEMAIAALDKDTNVPTNSALDNIHNVVKDDAYKRGYEQGKADAIKWIPFTADTAPKEDRLYFVKHKTKTGGKAISADSYSTAYGEWFINHNDAVIAWMPAPKEEGEQHEPNKP